MVDVTADKSDFLGRGMDDCVRDEVAIFQRALTDEEIAAGASAGNARQGDACH
jgi:hypothetical protein